MTDSKHRPAAAGDRLPVPPVPAVPAAPDATASLADASPAPLFVIQDHRLRYVNRAFAALAGCEPSELVGRTSLDVIHPDDRAHLLERGYEQEGAGVARSQFRLRRP